MSISSSLGAAKTQAASAVNLMLSTSLAPASVFTALRARAQVQNAQSLRFPDGSVLKFNPQSSSFYAL